MSRWRTSAANNYPQLVVSLVVLVLLLLLLPSGLNQPLSNPSETLEYAPVPPDSEAPPSTSGNFASLGLGRSASLASDTIGRSTGVGVGKGLRPSTKRCVGSPPRQTEDPLSPPCVAYWEGDNSGSTYQGVTREEIRILIRVETNVGQCGHFKGCQDRPSGEIHDLGQPEKPDEYYQDTYFRNWQRYFNERFQTYGRFVRFITHYHGETPPTPEARRAMAADHYSKVKPFAVLFDAASPDNLTAYQEVAYRRGMLVFVGGLGLSAEQFSRFPKLAWGFMPSTHQQALVFADYLCRKVHANPVSYSGNGDHGKPRKFGLVYTTDPDFEIFREFKDDVKSLVREQCGMHFALERTYTREGVHEDPQYAPEGAASIEEFRNAGVTTIVWPYGYETNLSRAAEAREYYPEWIIAGDGFNDGSWPGADQAKQAWEHAIVITPTPRSKPSGYTQTCEDAYTEVHPDIPRDGFDLTQACFLYPSLRQLFTGVQVAGPRLSPDSLDKGFRAIPDVPSIDPATPACFYVPGDQTCVKDAEIMWWDSQSDGSKGEISGCWRMALGGKRFLAGRWPKGNVNAPFSPNDPCNGWVAGFGTRVGDPQT